MDMQLTGKTAIITGGSRGIGKASARTLAEEGVDVVIASRDIVALEAAAKEISAETGRRIIPIQVDTGNDESVRSMVQQAVAALGHIDILVNSAAEPGGITAPPTYDQVTDELFWADMNVKVMGYLRTAREVAPHMVTQGWGRIINVSGLAARQTGSTLGSIRNVSVVALSKNLADTLGPKGINVNTVHPGATRTERLSEVYAERAAKRGITVEEVEGRIAANNSTVAQA